MQAICFITSLKSNCLRLLKLWGSKPYHSNWFFLRPEIKTASASKTAWAPAPKSSNQKIANETIKWFHLQTYDYTIENNVSCHVPRSSQRKKNSSRSMDHACMHGNLNWSNNQRAYRFPEYQIRCPKVKLWTTILFEIVCSMTNRRTLNKSKLEATQFGTCLWKSRLASHK